MTKWLTRAQVDQIHHIIFIDHNVGRVEIIVRQSKSMEMMYGICDTFHAGFDIKSPIIFFEPLEQCFETTVEDKTDDPTSRAHTSMIPHDVRMWLFLETL
jgi:hypothetical protein